MMAPAAANPAQVATPRARRSGGKAAVIVDKVPGMIMAAPIPMTTRAIVSWSVELANAAVKEAIPKTPVPMTRTVRRPMRSPRAPRGSTRAARATV